MTTLGVTLTALRANQRAANCARLVWAEPTAGRCGEEAEAEQSFVDAEGHNSDFIRKIRARNRRGRNTQGWEGFLTAKYCFELR